MLLQWQRDRDPYRTPYRLGNSQRPGTCPEETIGSSTDSRCTGIYLYDAQGLICPIMDARRKQVYTGIYRFEEHQLMTLKEQWAAPIEELLEELNQRGEMVTFLGDGVPVFRELIAEKLQVPYSFAPAHVNKQRAAAVAALGSIYYKEGRTETAMEHIPEYLRVSQAERERAEREKEQKPAGTKI